MTGETKKVIFTGLVSMTGLPATLREALSSGLFSQSPSLNMAQPSWPLEMS